MTARKNKRKENEDKREQDSTCLFLKENKRSKDERKKVREGKQREEGRMRLFLS